MIKLAVIGDPVAHSRSPELHRGFMEEAGIDGEYFAIRVPAGEVMGALRKMRDKEFIGCNVTYPLKEEALRACNVLDDEAVRIGAVNTIYFGTSLEKQNFIGTNTDGVGARLALEAIIGDSIALSRVGILGYGATARAILAQLSENDVYTFVWGRDQAKLNDVCQRFDARPWPHDNPPGIVISTLPPDAEIPSELAEELQPVDILMDTNYGERSTLRAILHRDVVTGEAMLEAQARASFDFWLAHLERVSPAESY